MILDQIVADRKKAVERLKEVTSIKMLEKEIENSCIKHYSFKAALQEKNKPIHIIAEIKKASRPRG